MPTSARKSSLGTARRGTLKAHIPYRGDNPEVGKKTGIAVQPVERKSDGFERFDELIQQADKRTPPKRKAGKRKQSEPMYDDEDDEYGEMSMELDDSPVRYLANSRHQMTPLTNHTGPSSRSVARTSIVDFDEIPSPRPRGVARKSMGHTSRPGPSRLSTSFRANDLDQTNSYNDTSAYQNAGEEDYENRYDAAGNSPPGVTSFTEMDQDDIEEESVHDEEQEQEPLPPAKKHGNGKSHRALEDVPEERESEPEDEIERGLDEVDDQRYSDDGDNNGDDLPEPSPRRTKKTKLSQEPQKSQARPHGKSRKENRQYREGVRRSAREHYKPLEWWRGEKLVYGRNQRSGGGPVLVPPIREIVRIPKEEPEPLGKRKRSSTRAPSKTKDMQIKIVPVSNPEEGWDDDTPKACMVMEYPSGGRKEMHVTHTARMINLRQVNDWMFEKVFGEEDFIAAGVLVIPSGAKKPTKQTKDNTYVFYIIQGAINLKIHETSLVLSTGAMFLIPRGNSYFIENICDRDVKLFFTQARKMVDIVDAGGTHSVQARRSSISGGRAIQPRSSSAGAAQAEGRMVSKTPAPARAASTR